MFSSPVEDQGPAGKDEQHNRLSGSDYLFHKLLLVAGQIEVGAGASFATHAAGFSQREQNDISLLRGLDGLRETSLRIIVDFGSLGVEQSATQLLDALCQRLPEGDAVAIFTGATPASYHLSCVVGKRSDESDPFACRRKRKQRRAANEFV